MRRWRSISTGWCPSSCCVFSPGCWRTRSTGCVRSTPSRSAGVGAAVLACNHVSFVDAVVIMGESPRPIRFVMDHRIFKIPLMNWFFKHAKAIAIAPAREDPRMLDARQPAHRCGTGRRRSGLHLSRRQDHLRRRTEPVQAGRAEHRRAHAGAGDTRWRCADSGDRSSRAMAARRSRRPVEARLQRGFGRSSNSLSAHPLPPDDVTPELLMARVAALRGDET